MSGMQWRNSLVIIHSWTAHPEGVSWNCHCQYNHNLLSHPTFLLNHNTVADTAVIHQLSRKNWEPKGPRSEMKQDRMGDESVKEQALYDYCPILSSVCVRVSKLGQSSHCELLQYIIDSNCAQPLKSKTCTGVLDTNSYGHQIMYIQSYGFCKITLNRASYSVKQFQMPSFDLILRSLEWLRYWILWN